MLIALTHKKESAEKTYGRYFVPISCDRLIVRVLFFLFRFLLLSFFNRNKWKLQELLLIRIIE